MVKTPKTRHSKDRREPLTIELDPADVTRVTDAEATTTPESAGVEPEAFDAKVGGGESTATDAAADFASEQMADGESRDATQDDRPAEDATATDTGFATETGTAAQPEQEYQPAEAAQEPADYRFDEAEAKRPDGSIASERTATTERATPPPPPPPQPRRDGFSRVAAGLIGAVVALAAAGGLQYAGVLGTPSGSVGAGPASADIESLRQEIAALRESAGGAGEVSSRVDGLSGALDAVKADVAALREALSSGSGGDAAGVQALDARLKELETAVSALGQNTGPDQAAVSALGERVAAVEALVKSTGEAARAADGRLAALEQSVSALTGRVDAQAQQPKIALAIATAALKAAVDRGEPFLAELEAFAAIAPDAPEIAALRALAEKGVPTREKLLNEIEPAAAAMIAASKPADPNAGYLDRLLQSAEALVTVRPIGDVAGAGAPEIIARMEVALKAGDLDKAITEFDSLPEPVKAAAGAFGTDLKARRDTERLVGQAIAGAMKA